jgi:hypothetical protein
MKAEDLLERDYIVQGLQHSLADGTYGLKELPEFVKSVIKGDMWQHRYSEKWKMEIEFKTFEEFVTAPLTKGLGATIQILKNLCRDDAVAINEIDKVTKHSQGGDRRSANFKASNASFEKKPKQNTKGWALRRLRDKAPEFLARVLTGELSPNGAMVQAGLKLKPITIVLDPERAARTVKRHFTAGQIRKLKELL